MLFMLVVFHNAREESKTFRLLRACDNFSMVEEHSVLQLSLSNCKIHLSFHCLFTDIPN